MNNDPMAERGRGGDETVAAQNVDATALGKTAGVPNRAPTEAVELAWSEGSEGYGGDFGSDVGGDQKDDRRPAPVGQSWGATVQRAGALLGICLVVAGAIVFAHWLMTSPKSPEKAAEPTTAAPTTSASAAPSTPLTQDDKYIQDLRSKGIVVINPDNAIANGQAVCKYFDQGKTRDWIVQFVKANLKEFADHASDFVAVASQYYCPNYS
jgi:Protein of unknown function (DUF732)